MRLGKDPARWEWGRLHTLELVNPTLGTSGIGAVEWLFNRGPVRLGGGSAIVDATGWTASDGYAVDWVPSMRMVVDLADLDRVPLGRPDRGVRSRVRAALLGPDAAVGGAARRRRGRSRRAAVDDAATHTLTLRP